MAHSCWVGFNVYFSRHGGEALDGLFTGGVKDKRGRVFATSRELVEYEGLRKRMEERLGYVSDNEVISGNMSI